MATANAKTMTYATVKHFPSVENRGRARLSRYDTVARKLKNGEILSFSIETIPSGLAQAMKNRGVPVSTVTRGKNRIVRMRKIRKN